LKWPFLTFDLASAHLKPPPQCPFGKERAQDDAYLADLIEEIQEAFSGREAMGQFVSNC
jgi:hypothetical protein